MKTNVSTKLKYFKLPRYVKRKSAIKIVLECKIFSNVTRNICNPILQRDHTCSTWILLSLDCKKLERFYLLKQRPGW